MAWRPTSYDDPEAVIAEAIIDVTLDLRAVFDKLGVSSPPGATSREAEAGDAADGGA